jgi:hypothetical protein
LSVLDTELSFLNIVNEIAKYQGFNPREIIKQLLDLYTTTKEDILADPSGLETIEAEIKVGNEMQHFRFSNNQDFHQDMQFICMMFITRGAAFDKIMRKSTETMSRVMNLLKVKYNINTTKRRPGTSLDSKTITIPRIAASFPAITVGLFHKNFGRSIIDSSQLFAEIDLPRAIFSPMIASVLPKTNNAPLAVILLIAVKTDDVLHQTDNKTALQALFQYLMASYNSTAVTEMVKQKNCEVWGIGSRMNGAFTYNPIILGLVQRSKASISELRSNDPNLQCFKSNLIFLNKFLLG